MAEATDGVTALEHIRSLKPDIAILDIGLPKMEPVALVRRIREEQIPVEIVFLTICDDEDIFEEALELGVKGYLLRDSPETRLLRCVTAVSLGQHYPSPSMTTYLVKKTRRVERFARQTPGLDLLTPQERTGKRSTNTVLKEGAAGSDPRVPAGDEHDLRRRVELVHQPGESASLVMTSTPASRAA